MKIFGEKVVENIRRKLWEIFRIISPGNFLYPAFMSGGMVREKKGNRKGNLICKKCGMELIYETGLEGIKCPNGCNVWYKLVGFILIIGLCWAASSYAFAFSLSVELPPFLNRVADAVFLAEGGRKAVVPYGVFYKGCDWSHERLCRSICKSTIENKLNQYLISNKFNLDGFIEYLSETYTTTQRKEWVENVKWFYERGYHHA